jgi:biotin carboxylase
MSKVLLIVGGGIETVPAIEDGIKMGLHVVVSDANPRAPGIRAAHENLIASTYDVEATIREAKKYHENVRPIDGVICIGSDIPRTVAGVAHALGLPGISPDAAHLASDKLAMKEKFTADSVPVPWFSSVSSVRELIEIANERRFPLVIKPVDSRGARGVLRIGPETDLQWAFTFSQRESPTGRVMVEEFLDGPQISTESIVLDGVAHTPGFADRNYEFMDRFAPHIIENGGDLPTRADAEEQQAVRDLIHHAAASMGVHRGVVKGDIVLHRGKAYVIELAARLSGGYLCTHEIPLSTGVDFVGCAIRIALGEKVNPEELKPRFQKCICQRYLFPQPGQVVQVRGAESAATMPGVAFCQVRVHEGDVVGPTHSHPARAGLVMAMGDSREEALTRTRNAVAAIEIETVPVETADPVGTRR